MTSEARDKPIRLGIDLGSRGCRVGYVHPDEEGAVVTVPFTLDNFRPCFPITEYLYTNDLYASRFFPGLTQRIARDFELNLFGRTVLARTVLKDLLRQAVDASAQFANRPVEGMVVCHPLWAGSDLASVLREGMRETGLTMTGLTSDVEAACAAFRANEMSGETNATVLVVSAGYTGAGFAVVRITPRSVRTLAEMGEQGLLAGNTIDFAIMQSTLFLLAEQRVDVHNERGNDAWFDFQYHAELAKQELGARDSCDFEIPIGLVPSSRGPMRAELVGEAFRAMIGEELDVCMDVVADLLEEAQVGKGELDRVLLVGGSTRLLSVTQRLREEFRDVEVRHLSPEAVANGAALLAIERAESERTPARTSREPVWFVPTRRLVPGLVRLIDPIPALADTAGLPSTGVPSLPVAPIDTVTLRAIRELMARGELRQAETHLRRLIDAAERVMTECRSAGGAQR